MGLSLLAILFLLTLSGFFSASETALTVASKAKIHKLAKEKDKRALIVSNLLASISNVISSLIAGITLIHVLTATIFGSWSSSALSQSGQIMASFLLGGFILIYSEIMPKMLALNYADSILLSTSKILHYIVLFFLPINKVINWLARKILRVFKLDQTHATSQHVDELKSYIDLHYTLYLSVNNEEKSMLQNILDLDELTVEEAMVHRKNVMMINADIDPLNLIEIVQATPYTRIPVYKDDPDNIVGILNVRSFLKYCFKEPREFNILEHISPPWFIPDKTNLLEQLRAFKYRKEHFSIVVDEYGLFLGIITLEDVLEEIVGEITDEYDLEAGELVECSNNAYLISGRYSIRDLNRLFDWNLPTQHASTVSGLIMYTAQKIPEEGEKFIIADIKFEIIKRQEHYISLVKAKVLNQK